MVGHATEPIIVWDADRTIVYRNPAAVRFATGEDDPGGPNPPAVSTRAIDPSELIVDPEDGRLVEKIARALGHRPGGTARFVARYRRYDGVHRWLEVTLSNQLDDPAVHGMVAYSRDITTEHDAQAALRDSETHFKALVEHSTDLIAIIDADGKVLRPTPTHPLGYPAGSLVGHSALSLIHPDDLEETRSILAQATAQPGHTLETEVRLQETDGTWRSFDITITNRLDDPAVGGFIVNGRDITDRRHAENILRGSEARFRRLVEHAPDVVYRWRLGTEPGFDYVSPSVERLSGYSVAELCADPALATRVLHPGDLPVVLAGLKDRASTGPYTVRWRRRDGGVTWVEHHAEPIRDNHGTLVAIEGIARDVTARVDAERELADSEARFRRLAERASDVIYRYRLTAQPGFEYVSPTVTRLTGFTPDEFYADPSLLWRLLHPDDREAAQAGVRDPVGAGRQMRVRWKGPNGTWVWTEHRTVPIFDDDGALVAAEGIARDVTEQVRAESELQESERLSGSVLESIAGPTGVLDATGTIVRANRVWGEYMRGSGAQDPASCGVGANFLTMLDTAAAAETDYTPATDLAAGVRAVLAKTQRDFGMDVPAPGVTDDRWYHVKVTPLRTDGGGVVLLHNEITDRKRYEHQLFRQAFHDPLTGLPNGTLLADRLDRALSRARRDDAACAILLIDVDRFHVINDAFGRVAADAVLTATSARLRALAPPSDTVCRLSGDQFVVLCENLSDQQAAAMAGRVLSGLALPVDVTGETVTPTVSIGVAFGDRTAHADSLLRHADAAMHQAKERGRNRFEFFDHALHPDALAWLSIEAALRRALTSGEFRLAYQPIVDLASGVLRSVEALLRWDAPDRGELFPKDFLSIAEESGLIVPIGTWVLQEACRQSRRWRDENPTAAVIPVAVNVAPHQLRRPEFVDEVVLAMADAGIGPEGIILELTETVLMDAHTTPVVAALHELGIRLALDDFGTGYSSLSHLGRYSVDTIKIDASFVAGVVDNPRDRAIITAVLGITRALALVAIAEGVETVEQQDELRGLGCDQAQGYLFGRAASPSAISTLLAARH